MFDAALFDEPGRIAALRRYDVLDSAPEGPFDKITALVRTILAVPIATVSLIDENRQWLKSQLGFGADETPRDASFCTHTIRKRQAMVIPDTFVDPRFAGSPYVVGPPYLRAYAGVPLRTPDGYNIGALCAIDHAPRAFTDAQIAILTNLAELVVDELELRQIAGSDALTGGLTRRGLLAQVESEMHRHRRYGRPSALLLLDIDHFKSVNDRFGHPVGDQVLRAVAGACRAAMRPSDTFGRVGGEEFALLLPETGPAEAMAAAERFRQAIEALAIDVAADTPLHVTASFGVAPIGEGIDSADAWLARADVPLYLAKHGGRNCCHLAPDRAAGC